MQPDKIPAVMVKHPLIYILARQDLALLQEWLTSLA
jgi:hypothetical protein